MAGGQFDAVIDGSGGQALNDFIKILNLGGIISFYGSTAGMPDRLNLSYLFLKVTPHRLGRHMRA